MKRSEKKKADKPAAPKSMPHIAEKSIRPSLQPSVLKKPPERLAPDSWTEGQLLTLSPSEDGEVIARLKKPCPCCSQPWEFDLALPDVLEEGLRPLVGEQMSVMYIEDEYRVRVLDQLIILSRNGAIIEKEMLEAT